MIGLYNHVCVSQIIDKECKPKIYSQYNLAGDRAIK